MSYTPNDPDIFNAAFTGALAGIAVSDRSLTSTDSATYAITANAVGAYAQEFDTIYGAGTVNAFTVEAVFLLSKARWENRGVLETTPDFYESEVNEIIALIDAGETYYSAQGITPPNWSSGSAVDKVKVSGADISPGYLASKLAAGLGIALTILNPAANESLEISATGVTAVSVADTTPDFLSSKIVAGTGITLTVLNPGGNETLQISGSGTPTWASVLGSGNVSGGHDPTITSGDTIRGQNAVAGDDPGGALPLIAGAGHGAGNGGVASLYGGSADAEASGGAVIVSGGAGGSTGGTGGKASLLGGSTTDPSAGPGGAVEVISGDGVQSGDITIATGTSRSAAFTGSINILVGNTLEGPGGSISLSAGNAFTSIAAPYQGGVIAIAAGSSTGNAAAGSITINGGTGGTGVGGTITCLGGTGGTGAAGGAVSYTGGTGDGAGNGGAATISGGTAGATGNGGAATIQGGLPTNGNGGGVNVTGRAAVGTNKNGGAVGISSGAATGTGAAGNITITGGQAGTGAGSTAGTVAITGGSGNTNAAGAAVSMTGGAGGAATQAGGAASVTGGIGNTTGTGGVASLVSGRGGATGAGATTLITGGAGGATSGAAGGATVAGGIPVDGAGGAVTLTGSSGVGTNRAGGNLSGTAGNSTGSGAAGTISFTAGTGGTVAGGAASITGGTGGTNSNGGATSVVGGAGTGSGTGGATNVTAGAGGATGVGGGINITTGAGGATSGASGALTIATGTPIDGAGGSITITATAGATTTATARNGGSVTLKPGAAASGGTAGTVALTDSANAKKFEINATGIGFFATAPVAQQAVTTYQSLVTALSTIGLFTVAGATSPMPGQIIYWGGDAGAYAADSVLSIWAPNAHPTSDEAANGQIPVTQAGTVKNLRLHALNGNISVANFITVIRKNGVNQTLAATITSGSASASDTTHSFTVVEGDLLSIKVTGNGTTVAALGSVWASVEVQ